MSKKNRGNGDEQGITRLRMCSKCGKHGRIITADDIHSAEFHSLDLALFTLELGLQSQELSEQEFIRLTGELKALGLPADDLEADRKVSMNVYFWNMALASYPEDPAHRATECVLEFIGNTVQQAEELLVKINPESGLTILVVTDINSRLQGPFQGPRDPQNN